MIDPGSFTRAAERLGITKAVVSQQVARLERYLGTTLLIRTTRRVHPIHALPAARFRPPKVIRFVEMLIAAKQKVGSGKGGRCKVGAPR